MFVCASTLVLAIAASVIASPGSTRSTVNQCNNGEIQCCSNTMTASQVPESILGLLDLGSINGLIGLNCNPIVGVLGGGAACTGQAVCCTGTHDLGQNNFGFGQLIGLDCSPVNLVM